MRARAAARAKGCARGSLSCSSAAPRSSLPRRAPPADAAFARRRRARPRRRLAAAAAALLAAGVGLARRSTRQQPPSRHAAQPVCGPPAPSCAELQQPASDLGGKQRAPPAPIAAATWFTRGASAARRLVHKQAPHAASGGGGSIAARRRGEARRGTARTRTRRGEAGRARRAPGAALGRARRRLALECHASARSSHNSSGAGVVVGRRRRRRRSPGATGVVDEVVVVARRLRRLLHRARTMRNSRRHKGGGTPPSASRAAPGHLEQSGGAGASCQTLRHAAGRRLAAACPRPRSPLTVRSGRGPVLGIVEREVDDRPVAGAPFAAGGDAAGDGRRTTGPPWMGQPVKAARRLRPPCSPPRRRVRVVHGARRPAPPLLPRVHAARSACATSCNWARLHVPCSRRGGGAVRRRPSPLRRRSSARKNGERVCDNGRC